MQTRNLAGCKRLLTAAAVASLTVLPAAAGVTPVAPPTAKPGFVKQAPATSATTKAIGQRNLKQPVFYPRSNYVWPFASGPTYGEVDSSRWNDTGVVHTLVGSFDLTRGEPNFPAELRTSVKLGGSGTAQYFLLQVRPEAFSDGSFEQLKATIAAQGGAIVEAMPVGAFFVRLTPGAYDAIAGSPTVLALMPDHPALKIAPLLGRVPLADPVKAVSDTYSLQLLLFPGESSAAVAQSLAALGIAVTRETPDIVYADVPVSKLAAVAGIEAIHQIFEDLPLYLNAEETTCTVQTGRLNSGAVPYNDAGVDGGGGSTGNPQILMVLDSGIQLDAGDLSNTRTDAGTAGAGHRKVLFYGTTNPFGGQGDQLGCDAPTSGGFTHGHTVSATALGNGSNVPAGYGTGWTASDANGNPWNLDGVAPRAKEVFYDGSVTPSNANCEDPLAGGAGINPGTLYSSGTGALADGYTRGARTVNFSWGGSADQYDGNATQIDSFIFDKGDAMVFIAAGNNGADTGTDGIGEPNTVGAPATTKNGVAVGASFNSDDQFDVGAPNDRAGFSSNGPGPTTGGRTLPMIMAPGVDAIGGQGLVSEFNCRSGDNDQANPVQCDVVSTLSGTSFASPAAAGAALLIRDYFAQGFYPDGTSSNPGNASDQVADISGALVKAILIDSADWMTRPTAGNPNAPGGNLSWRFRFNNEQGYGRVKLTNALPLQTYAGSVTGLIVADGGIAGGVNNTTLNTNLAANSSTSYSLNVCDTTQPINIGMAWVEASGDALVNNLDLELVSPSGRKYVGNYYTEDTNQNKTLDTGENCDYTGLPWPPNSSGALDQGPWSLPTAGSGVSCSRTTFNDTKNPTEGIHLSPDTLRNGIQDDPNTATNEAADNQIEAGTWTVTVKSGANPGPQKYALAISGGVCLGSSVRIQKVAANNQLAGGTFVCNDSAVVTVNEVDDPAHDPAAGLTPSEISSRTRVDVIDAGADGVFGTGDDVITDTETGLTFTQGAGLAFNSSSILLTEGTAPDPGNHVLDIRSGQQVRVTYQDKKDGSPDPNAKRVNTGNVDCRTAISAGGVNFAQFGMDTWTFVSGGCERDARGYFTFGYPDQYIDAGETVGYLVAFQSAESTDTLKQVTVSLRAVDIDGDSPANCKPGSVGVCADPNRANNPPSPYVTVLDSPREIGTLAPSAIATASFTVRANASISGVHKADFVVGVSAKTAGKSVESFAVQRETLNADATTFFYNTDFPLGGASLNYDSNNNEVLETVTTDPKNFSADYNFETQSYSDMTATGFNTAAGLKAPWNFDTNDGGFTSGLNSNSTPSTVLVTMAQWGEDKNFNNKLDGTCSGNTTLVCTQGLPSQGCNFCNGDHSVVCSINSDCTLYGGTCQNFGSCTYSNNEDRDTANSALDQNWSTNGGCGWQTKGGSPNGGIWHTGTIRAPGTSTTCLATGSLSARCQTYEKQPAGDGSGNHVWWEMLLTPAVQKVNQCPSANGTNCPTADAPDDPVYQIAITNWAWNMEMDIGDLATGFIENFDTDLDKLQPTDMFNDGVVLNVFFGQQGAITGGNAPLFGGFQMFAPVISCVDTDGQGQCSITTGTACFGNSDCPGGETCINFPDHCSTVAGATCHHDYECTSFGNTTNGTVGNNRSGVNNCAFEGQSETDSTHSGTDSAKALKPWGLATPADDDAANGYCQRPAGDPLQALDKSISCTSNVQCVAAGAPYNTTPNCVKADSNADEFVQANGPGRNFSIANINGPDMRFLTLEDIYGPTGNRFQAALAIYNFDPTPSTFGGAASYGFGVDDMFLSWKETRLDEDTHNCADAVNGGQCADIEMQQTRSYDGNDLVEITVTDDSPYDPVNAKNDCDQNGSYSDPGDDTDCNNNGKNDVIVRVSSPDETPGEIVALDETSPGSHVYKASVPYSTEYDSPGTVFARANGNTAPVITARYVDRNDGTGKPCHNALDPSQDSIEQASISLFLSRGFLTVKSYRVKLVGTAGTNGDDDGYPDRNETDDLYITFTNRTHVPLDNVVAAIVTSDSKIDCISRAIVTIPHFGSGNAGDPDPISVETPTPFRFKVKDVSRGGVNDDFSVTFHVTLHTNKFDITSRSLEVKLDLNLTASGGGSTSAFVEDFESKKGLGTFTPITLDAGKNSLTLSDGFRCQYNDPNGINTNSAGNADCFLGFATDPASGVNDWHLHQTSGTGASRAYTGAQSMHYGVHVNNNNSLRDTLRFKQLDAVQTSAAINLPTFSANPELTFFQQYASDDSRFVNVTPGETPDRGVVEVRLASGGSPIGNWIKIYPYENEYDEQGTDDFFNCVFDPTDDGNNEDSFFDPNDPARRLGPSSTCYPEFTFGFQGDTDWRNTFNSANVGNADGQAFQGSINRGTWVQPKFNLAPFAARSIFLRFIFTTIEVGTAQTYDSGLYQRDNITGDDGWYIDNIHIDQALSSPVSLAVDNTAYTPLGGSCAACTNVTATLTSSPSSSSGPGQLITLDASGSSIDSCPNGVPQYQFWIDANGNGIVGDAGDTLLRDWTDNPTLLDTPNNTTRYAVTVRCSSQPACDAGGNSTVTPVTVTCPSTGNATQRFQAINVGKVGGLGGAEPDTNVQVTWTTTALADVVRGNLNLLKSSAGNFTGTVIACNNDINGTSAPAENNNPGAGNGYYYLARPGTAQYCNAPNSYSTGNPKETPGRDAEINADANACP